MPTGRPPLEPMPNWPALMTTPLAAKYLSVDEHSLRVIMRAHGLAPVDLKLDVERWRRAELDRMVRDLPTMPLAAPAQPPAPRVATMSDADVDRIVARLQGARAMARPRAYSIKDAAATCGLSRTTLYRLAKEGRLAPVRVAGRTLIPAEQLDELMRSPGSG